MSGNWLSFQYELLNRKGLIAIVAKYEKDIPETDTLDILNAQKREAFLEKYCKGKDGIHREEVKDKLNEIANEVLEKIRSSPTETLALEQMMENEIMTSFIVRPERFIAPEVSGLSIPIMRKSMGELQGQWILYLHWADGRREMVPLTKELTVPNDKKIWFHPIPPDLKDATAPAWSTVSRKEWLAGTESLDPADVFRTLCEMIQNYLDFPADHAPGATALLALWVILTYNYPAWDAIPYLYFGGPLGSGKSRALQILSLMAFRPLSCSNLTAPALFRTLHQDGGTLFYDEAERLKQNAPETGEILSMLLAGYKRGGKAIRLEPEGDSFRSVKFDVYGPKALACITGLPPNLSSRCITVMMFKAGKNSAKPRRRLDEHSPRWQHVRDELHLLALNHGINWLKLPENHQICPQMAGRSYELWQPILALADWLEKEGAEGLLELMQEYAKNSIHSSQEDEVPAADELVLQSLVELLRIGQSPQPKIILDRVKGTDPEIFHGYSAKGIANLLKRYGITTSKSKGARIYNHVSWEKLKEIENNYGFDLGLEEYPNVGFLVEAS